MSWEEMYTCSATCPCGKGKITQTSYGDGTDIKMDL